MPSITVPVGRGGGTGIDPSLLDQGQLQEAIGVAYDISNPAAKKVGGRSHYNAAAVASAAIKSIIYFDSINGNPFLISSCSLGYQTSPMDGVFTTAINGGAVGSGIVDNVVFNDNMMLVKGTGNNHVMNSSKTIRRLGLSTTDASTVSLAVAAGPGQTGTYTYWATEYDSTNLVESALTLGTTTSPATITLADQNTLVTSTPTWNNPSANRYRIYRTIAGGAYPNGWLVAEKDKGVTVFTDTLSDATLVANSPYPIVTINDISESLNYFGNWSFSSITGYQGSLVAARANDDSIYYTETGQIDSWPSSYRMRFNPVYGGSLNCVRALDDACYVFFTNETFIVNYLPKASDAVFDGGIAQHKIANYGTPSHLGACIFSGTGMPSCVFFVSNTGPMLCVGGVVDRAVGNIDWANTVAVTQLSTCKVIDNPQRQRVELFFNDSASDTTSWSALHFYYDSMRLTQKTGPLPELAWTGPHKVPGPGCYAIQRVSGNNGSGVVYAGSQAADGFVYLEDDGTSDAALLVDAVGTVNFRLRTAKLYPVGMDGEARGDRLHIHKAAENAAAGNADYQVTFYAHREESGVMAYQTQIKAETAGLSSVGLNSGFRGFDVRITHDGITAMPPINNITLRYEDAEKFGKTTR